MEAGTGGVNDLATLATLDEGSLLEEIRARYHQDIIYTYIGDILIAVNPYRTIMLYGPEFIERYTQVKVRTQLAPHIYAISDTAYQNMRLTGSSQCCVVSGESGAGKTESTKLMVQHIASLCRHDSSRLHERIVQVNPLLEAFGNAQTVMNNNSSRFGKYIEMRFGEDGEILGAKISEYLLEKSRVVSQGAGERNFHIFYYLFAGLDSEQLQNNLLCKPENHRILQPLDGAPIFLNEKEFQFYQDMWDKLRFIMQSVGFSNEEVGGILAILASILHITDIQFEHDYDTDGVYIANESMMEMAAEMLGVQPEDMAGSLISNVTHLRGERIVSLKGVQQANDGRDALAKALYGRLFGWIVRQINQMIQPNQRRQVAGPTIGILDIAGFENFQNNSFEQLCINVTNEQLQYYFNQHIFQWELDEYKREGVKGKDFKFISNRPVVDFFLESPLGFFSLLDEESKFPQASDQTFIEKVNKNLGKKGFFQRPKGQTLTFVIQHYAGPVTYGVFNFLEKNRDTLSWNLLDAMKKSESQFVSDLFFSAISATGSLQVNPNTPKRSRKSLLLCKAPELSLSRFESLSKKAGKRLKDNAGPRDSAPTYESTIRTMGMHYKNSLTELMGKLLHAQPHFIRCIKPNMRKMPQVFEPELVMTQLKYTGVLETVKIRRQGYATRIPHAIFIQRYKMLAYPLTAEVDPTANNCVRILKTAGLKDWEVGKTKVFLKYWHPEQLNLCMDQIGWRVVDCQRFVRGFLAKRKVSKLWRLAAHDLQDTRDLCSHVCHISDKIFYDISRQMDHDSEKFHRMQQEKAARVRKAQAQLRPPSTARNSRESRSREGLYMPTPIILGNPVFGNSEPITNNPNHMRQAGRPTSPPPVQPKKGLRRTPASQYVSKQEEYPTVTMQSPTRVKAAFEYDQASHLRRPVEGGISPSVLSPAAKGNKAMLDDVLRDTLIKFPSLDKQVWAKVFYYEKSELVEKLYLRDPEVIIDSSTQMYDGKVVGLGAFDNPYRDSASLRVLRMIDKGIKLHRDAEGNIYGRRLGGCNIIVKEHKNPENQCLSADIIEHYGRLGDDTIKIFDMKEFKSHIAIELTKSRIDEDRLRSLSVFSFAFEKNTFDNVQTPCWVAVINFCALDILGSETVLHEVAGLAHLNLGDADEVQLRRNWCKMYTNRKHKTMSQLPMTGSHSSTGSIVAGDFLPYEQNSPNMDEYVPMNKVADNIGSDGYLPMNNPQVAEQIQSSTLNPPASKSVGFAQERSGSPTYSNTIQSGMGNGVNKKDWAKKRHS